MPGPSWVGLEQKVLEALEASSYYYYYCCYYCYYCYFKGNYQGRNIWDDPIIEKSQDQDQGQGQGQNHLLRQRAALCRP